MHVKQLREDVERSEGEEWGRKVTKLMVETVVALFKYV